jgi:hypothetical protein
VAAVVAATILRLGLHLIGHPEKMVVLVVVLIVLRELPPPDRPVRGWAMCQAPHQHKEIMAAITLAPELVEVLAVVPQEKRDKPLVARMVVLVVTVWHQRLVVRLFTMLVGVAVVVMLLVIHLRREDLVAVAIRHLPQIEIQMDKPELLILVAVAVVHQRMLTHKNSEELEDQVSLSLKWQIPIPPLFPLGLLQVLRLLVGLTFTRLLLLQQHLKR